MSTAHLAIDLGASSGRAIVGLLHGNPAVVELEEVHRFEHHPCPTPAGPVWDLTGIWLNVLEGIRQAADWCREKDVQLLSVGVDTWGVDWALVGKSGELLALPHCYRDPQNHEAMDRVLEIVGGRESLYARTGIQLMQINSLFQVAARTAREPELVGAAHRLLFMPDLFHYWLSGKMTTERTIASTSGMLALETGDWDIELMEQLDIPTGMLGPIIDPGDVIGNVRGEIAEATGVRDDVKVIAPGAHDTASAVAAVPVDPSFDDAGWAYLSSGTWSLLGAELGESFASEQSCAAPFTNELGLSGTTRFLKNIAGLWLVQELRREELEAGREISYPEMAEQAAEAGAFRTLIDPNAAQFAAPGNMAAKIKEFAEATEQSVPETLGELVRCCLDSLALCYRETVDLLEDILGQPIKVLYIVGGGANNRLLTEITATVLQRPVSAGPTEATAIGNVLTQALGCGELADRFQIRDVVSRSFEPEVFLPENSAITMENSVYSTYRKILGS
ncbi:rhamnulokinase [bacterium]|nr:rhamnulokinase [bacterium]